MNPPPGTAKRLGGRAGHDVRMEKRRFVHTGGDEACDMGHVDEEPRSHASRDLSHALEVDGAGVGRATGDEELRTHLVGAGLDRVVVEKPGRAVHHVVV